MKFYPADWRADPRLRDCSLAARGLWIELLGLMHEGEPYGHFRLRQGLTGGVNEGVRALALKLGVELDELSRAFAELQREGVFDLSDDGVISSRRMVRDAQKAAINQANGRKGGNPRLSKPDGDPPKGSDNPSVKGEDKAQKPEARSQNNNPPPSRAGATPEGPKPLWAERLERAHEILDQRGSQGLPGLMTFVELRRWCEPEVGAPCDWDLDVIPAIVEEAARAKAAGKLVKAWGWFRERAISNRDRRLAGNPPPSASAAQSNKPYRRETAQEREDRLVAKVLAGASQ